MNAYCAGELIILGVIEQMETQTYLKHVQLFNFLAPADDAFVEEGWVLGTVLCEVRMFIVEGDHDAQVLLDSTDVEFEEGPALVLVLHFILDLSK